MKKGGIDLKTYLPFAIPFITSLLSLELRYELVKIIRELMPAHNVCLEGEIGDALHVRLFPHELFKISDGPLDAGLVELHHGLDGVHITGKHVHFLIMTVDNALADFLCV